jgi:hypothetical protein
MSRTPEERLAVLETEMAGIKAAVGRIDERTATLAEAYTMGKGAWKATMKIGAVIIGIIGGIAWLLDHLPQWLKG